MKKSNTDIVLDAIKDLHAQEQIATRETLADLTGLKLTVIDDRVSHLIDNGLVFRVQRGVFVPAPEHRPMRIITKSVLPDGSSVIEIGDDHVVVLTPREARALGLLMSGAAQQYASIELGHQAASLAGDITFQIKQLRQEMRALKEARVFSTGAERAL